MKKLLIAGLLIVGMLVSASSAMAANTADGQADANVLTPIGITNTQGLNFGNALSGETITILNADVVTADTVLTDKGTQQAALFFVEGTAAESYTTMVPADVTLNESGGATILATLDCDNTGADVLDGSGEDNITCGGSITLAGDQAPGAYSGTFTLEVNYP